jgi:hypothetical protein
VTFVTQAKPSRSPAESPGESASASLMLLGLGERLAISILLSGVAFLGVAWALA